MLQLASNTKTLGILFSLGVCFLIGCYPKNHVSHRQVIAAKGKYQAHTLPYHFNQSFTFSGKHSTLKADSINYLRLKIMRYNQHLYNIPKKQVP